MVYRGKPSAGCETCRKAKKKCTLELPACSRCVKLNKQCSGYRDTTELQIQDETLSVTRKAERKNAQTSVASDLRPLRQRSETATPAPNPTWVDVALSRAIPQAPAPRGQIERDRFGEFWRQGVSVDLCPQRPVVINKHDSPSLQPTTSFTPPESPPPPALHSGPPSSSEDAIDSPLETGACDAIVTRTDWNDKQQWAPNPYNVFGFMSIPTSLGPKPEDVAVSYFLNYFTADGHWDYLVRHASRPSLDPCLTLAIRACGMAALENVQHVPGGRAWCRKAYMKAIGLLNDALRDPVRSKKDESLMAVTMLSFFEVSHFELHTYSTRLTPFKEPRL
jgi:hypothetical protein